MSDSHEIMEQARINPPDMVITLTPSRQPHLGYTFAFAAMAFLFMQIVLLALLAVGESLHLLPMHAAAHMQNFPKLSVLAMTLAYGGSVAIAFGVFPMMWQRSFGDVLEWNANAVRIHLRKLIGLGILLSITAQGLQRFLPIPKSMPMDDYFRTRSDAWTMLIFGTFIAPAFEELLFRGFLLRALAIAWDWLTTPKTPEAQFHWHTTGTLSRPALLIAALISSLAFAVMHAAQLAHAWSTVGVLWIVGLILTWVRLHFRSLSASTVVHASYNGFIFAIMFVYTSGFQHLERMIR